MSNITITDVYPIVTAPYGCPLVIVKVVTSEPGLYGVGCATFTQRYLSVANTVRDYMKPFLVGKDPTRIEDIWQTAMVSAYWRNGPVLNNAISGVDEALWDIKGKMAGLPVYQLLGGKCREAAAVYRHADGRDCYEVEDNVRKFMEQGYRYIRCQMGGYGGKAENIVKPEGALPGAYYDPASYARSVPKIFEHVRKTIGFDIELLHDMHERTTPIDAVRVAKELEPYQLFFLEDSLGPETVEWFRIMRSQVTTPIAMGELFNHPLEYRELIQNRLIDYIRCHISQLGGITPARKLANFAEVYSVRTAWHGPGDTSPVGHSANVHLDLACWNFGIQEWCGFPDIAYEVFPGMPYIKNGYAYVDDKPGLGVDVDEKLAAKFPCDSSLPFWTMSRTPDGTINRP